VTEADTTARFDVQTGAFTRLDGSDGRSDGGGRGGETLPTRAVLKRLLDQVFLTVEQKLKIAEYERELDANIDKVLTVEQRRWVADHPNDADALSKVFTDAQRERVKQYCNEFDVKVAKVLTDSQNVRLKALRESGPGGK
jgi:hypothetical protein